MIRVSFDFLKFALSFFIYSCRMVVKGGDFFGYK